jgi:phosphoglycerate dehydrogenase-like enzyme
LFEFIFFSHEINKPLSLSIEGFDMRGKTVGIIGTGKIGKCTCEILLGFGCKILAYDVIEDRELAQRESNLSSYYIHP